MLTLSLYILQHVSTFLTLLILTTPLASYPQSATHRSHSERTTLRSSASLLACVGKCASLSVCLSAWLSGWLSVSVSVSVCLAGLALCRSARPSTWDMSQRGQKTPFSHRPHRPSPGRVVPTSEKGRFPGGESPFVAKEGTPEACPGSEEFVFFKCFFPSANQSGKAACF